MTNGADWQKGNARYLSAAMAWLRACLEQLAGQQKEEHRESQSLLELPVVAAPEGTKSVWRQFLRKPPQLSAKTPSLLLPSSAHIGIHDLHAEQATAAMQAAASEMDPPPALLLLSQRLGLSQFERQVLILCLGMELDTGVA